MSTLSEDSKTLKAFNEKILLLRSGAVGDVSNSFRGFNVNFNEWTDDVCIGPIAARLVPFYQSIIHRGSIAKSYFQDEEKRT